MTSPRPLDVAWLRALSRVVQSGVVAIDDKHRIQFASDRAYELLGLELGAGFDALSVRLRESTGVRDLGELPERAQPAQIEGCDGSGTTSLHVHAEPVDGTRGRLLFLTDACTIEELRSTLRVVSRDPGLTNFDARVVHDLKAPLNVLALHVELIKRRLMPHDTEVVDRLKTSLDVMKSEIQRLDHMLLEALDVAVEHDAYLDRRFDVARFLPRFCDLVRPLCRFQDVEFVIDVPRAPLTVYGDVTRLKQALLNLVINALDAMKGAGRLDLSAAMQDGRVRILVGDTGPGFPPDQLDTFWASQRTPRPDGHGIGLAVVRTVIQGLGGQVRVENRAPRGCVFTIELPLAP